MAKQVLQTLSIIVQNLRSETGIHFLFSNNHLNNIVETQLDWEDEEVLGYYISFLKALSQRLDAATVQFFLMGADQQQPPSGSNPDSPSPSVASAAPPLTPKLPLYSEAIRLAHHRCVRIRGVLACPSHIKACHVRSHPCWASYLGTHACSRHTYTLRSREGQKQVCVQL